MTEYSKELKEKCIQCFKEDDDLIIDEETAEEYLDGFANIFLAYMEKVKTKDEDLLKE